MPSTDAPGTTSAPVSARSSRSDCRRCSASDRDPDLGHPRAARRAGHRLRPLHLSSSRAAATRHLRVGGVAIDTAVAAAFLAALQPAALQACLAAAQQLEDGHDAALAQWRRQVEQGRYQAGKAERAALAQWRRQVEQARHQAGKAERRYRAASTRTTGWSPGVWKPSGTPRCNSWPTPSTSSLAA